MNKEDFHTDEFYDGYILGRLSAAEEDLFEEHLLFCEHCRRELEIREAITAGYNSDEDIFIKRIDKNKLSQKRIIIILSIAASVVIITGYSLYSIFIPHNDKQIAAQEEINEDIADITGDLKEPGIITESAPETEMQSENMLAEAFIPSPMFENAIENQVRSDGLSVISPDNSQTFKPNDPIEFHWRRPIKQLILVIFNNKGTIIFEKKIESPFVLNQKFLPGLYYWQLETEDEALCTLKFIVQ